MEVYDQLGDTLTGELLYSRFDIELELFGVVSGKSADVHLETSVSMGNKVLADVLLTAPVLPSGRMYDLMGPVLPETGGIVGTWRLGRPTAEAGVKP